MITNTKIKAAPSSGATLLWTNPSPNYSTNFYPQVVTFESGYTHLLVEFQADVGNTNTIAVLPFTETPYYFGDCSGTSQFGGQGRSTVRAILYVRDGEISFGYGLSYYDRDYNQENYRLKPLRIWGIN